MGCCKWSTTALWRPEHTIRIPERWALERRLVRLHTELAAVLGGV
jgi:hypothetical protein